MTFGGLSSFRIALADDPTGGSRWREGNGEVYVVDARDRVVVLGPQGDFRREWGASGIALGQFEAPLAVEVDEQSRIYVLDAGNHRMQVLDPAGTFLTGWGH